MIDLSYTCISKGYNQSVRTIEYSLFIIFPYIAPPTPTLTAVWNCVDINIGTSFPPTRGTLDYNNPEPYPSNYTYT